MSEWVQPVVLSGRFVRLEPLTRAHAPALAKVAEPEVFRFFGGAYPRDASVAETEKYIEFMRARPALLPFATVRIDEGEAVGVTTYMDIRDEHRGLEIGSTWIGRAHQGTVVNPEAKLLMLAHAFEALGAHRVQLKTDRRNLQSQAAIRKLGAVEEGILRQHHIMPDGYIRDTVMFSIIASEWPAVRARLEARVSDF